MKTMHKQLTTFTLGAIGSLAAIGFAPMAAHAQSITLDSASNFSNTQNFNTLATSGTSSILPNGWFFLESGGNNANTNYAADNGSTNVGNTYSYGTTGSTERALGSLTDTGGQAVTSVVFGARYTVGTNVDSFLISYTGEQWRRGNTSNTDSLAFQFSVDQNATLTSGNWQNFPTLNFVSSNVPAIDTAGTNAPLYTQTFSNVRVNLGPTLTSNQSFWIRWTDSQVGTGNNSNNKDNGMAVDDVTVSVPEPTTILGGMAALGIGRAVQRKWQRGRKKTAAAKA